MNELFWFNFEIKWYWKLEKSMHLVKNELSSVSSNGSIYINAEDFDKMFAFVKETSNGIANKEEWKKKVF